MNPVFQLILIGVGQTAVSIVVSMYLFRWRKREETPETLLKAMQKMQDHFDGEVRHIRGDVVTLRGQVKYIEGRLNGKHWREA